MRDVSERDVSERDVSERDVSALQHGAFKTLLWVGARTDQPFS